VQRNGTRAAAPGAWTWRARGALLLPNGPSNGRPVAFEVTAYGGTDLVTEWTTVPVGVLLQHQDVWLAP